MSNLDSILATIKRSQLVSPDVVEELQRKLQQSPQPVDLRSAVRWLVQKEHITSDQGRRLLSAQTSGPATPAEEMGLAPMDEEPPKAAARPSSKPAAPQAAPEDDDDLELFPLDEPPAAPVARPTAAEAKPAGGAARWAGTPRSSPPPSAAPTARPAAAPAARPAAAPVARPAASQRARPAAPAQDLFVEPNIVEEGGWEGADDSYAPEGRPPKTLRQERNIWDSPLLLIGGGSLLALVILGGGLYWALRKGNSDEAFKAAEADYSAGSYTQAIAKFDAFLENFPDNEHASEVRVDRGMAQMRQAVDAGRNWPQTLETAKKIIGEISSEKDFKNARDELAALLPAIAQGLANQAREKLDPALVAQAHETEKLVGKYVSKEMMPTQRMADVSASLAQTERMLGRDAALEETLKSIQQAIADGTPQVAYAERKQLLKMYSDLSTNERLQQAVQSLSDAVREQTRYVAEPKPAAGADAASPVEAEVVLANRQGGEAPGMAGEIVYALAGGAAYALQADNGTVLWRRFVGFDVDFLPRPVTLDPASDVILVDAKRQQLLRVAGRSGELRWRSEIGEPFDAHPVIARNQVWLATRSGRLAVLDLETGDAAGYLQIPQGLRVGPAFDSRGQTLYQLGENSNLYVIAAQTNECREVLYLGHEPESVRVPPVAVHPYIFIAENNSASDSVLHVLRTDEQGLNVRPAHASLPLSGHVLAPPVVAGRNLVVATDRGAIYSFEINAPDPGPPLTKVAESPAEDAAPFVRYPLLKDAQLWVAGGGLTKFDIHAARGRLEPKWIQDEGDVFVGPPTVRGDVVFHARRKKNLPEILVSAIHAGDGVRIWEAQLAAPPAGAPMTGQTEGAMTVVNAAGSLFEVPSMNLQGRSVQDKALAAMSLDHPLAEGAAPALLADGRLAIGASQGQSKALIAEGAAPRAMHWLSLPDPLGAAPVGFAGGLLAPGKLGQVFVLDPATGRQLIAAFQPRLQSGETFAWSNPVRLGENEVLLADGRNSLYRLGIADKPQPHLVALATAELPGPVSSPVVALTKTAYAVDGAGQLRAYSLPDLKPGPVLPLGGVQWGPARAADRALVLTRGGELACFDEAGQQLWKVAWPHGPLAGAPLAGKDGYLLATVSGTVFRMAADSGQELGKCDVGEPLGAGPVAVGDRLCLAAHGGALLMVASP